MSRCQRAKLSQTAPGENPSWWLLASGVCQQAVLGILGWQMHHSRPVAIVCLHTVSPLLGLSLSPSFSPFKDTSHIGLGLILMTSF